jgi:hypothetical protein
MKQVRENLAEASSAAWENPAKLKQSTVVVNAMGKIINSVAIEVKVAELAKVAPRIEMLGHSSC